MALMMFMEKWMLDENDFGIYLLQDKRRPFQHASSLGYIRCCYVVDFAYRLGHHHYI